MRLVGIELLHLTVKGNASNSQHLISYLEEIFKNLAVESCDPRFAEASLASESESESESES